MYPTKNQNSATLIGNWKFKIPMVKQEALAASKFWWSILHSHEVNVIQSLKSVRVTVYINSVTVDFNFLFDPHKCNLSFQFTILVLQ